MARNSPALTPDTVNARGVRGAMSRLRCRFRRDDAAQVKLTNILLSLVIGYVVILFVSILLFQSIGPDVNNICNDPTNYTAQECEDATTARQMFWTILIMAGVAVIIAIVAIVTGQVGSTGGQGGGGGRRRR